MKRGIARNGITSQLSSLKARVDEAWGKSVWTQPQLRHLQPVVDLLGPAHQHALEDARHVADVELVVDCAATRATRQVQSSQVKSSQVQS